MHLYVIVGSKCIGERCSISGGDDQVNAGRVAGSSEDSNRAFSSLQLRSCPESDVTGNSGEGIGETGHTGSRSTGNSGEGIGNTGSTDCGEYESPSTTLL